MNDFIAKKSFNAISNSQKITILTATLNAEAYIHRLIDSLRNQVDQNFEWLVVDGCSSDRTVEFVESAFDLSVRCIVSKDFGIYDALNRGIQAIDDGYYLVVGADDLLLPNAIKCYRKSIPEGYPDIVTAAIYQSGKVILPKKGLGWLYGLPGIASSHAVGMLFKVDLHKRFGLYSRKFPIAADQLFVKIALAGGASILRKKFIAGIFSDEGTSGCDPVGLLTDVFRVQLLTERLIFMQYLIFMLRIFKLYLFSALHFSSFRFPQVGAIKD